MPCVDIGGLEVDFPFEPYPTQRDYMESVVEALNDGHNALLESPTGTGKTLCLLCSSLAWLLRHKKTAVRGAQPLHPVLAPQQQAQPQLKVVYCSRTHAQLTQVIRELKRSAYGEHVTMALLGSREHMCVNSEVSRLPSTQAQQSMCRTLRANKGCRFFRGLQMNKNPSTLSDACLIHDMEDLVVEGKKNGFCPYYHERDSSKDADIVFMPYNYILDPSLRAQLPFELRSCIVIVDEAHNLPSVLSSSGCQNLAAIELTNAIHDCSRAVAMQRLFAEKDGADVAAEAMKEQKFASLKIILCRLEQCIGNEKAAAKKGTAAPESAADGVAGEIVHSGAYMETFLAKALITHDIFDELNETISSAVTAVAQSDRPASGLGHVQKFLASVFTSPCISNESTRFVIQDVVGDDRKRSPSKRSLGFWQLDNSQELQELSDMLRSMLLTSGTLSPLDHFAAELGVPFQIRLRGSHVISPEQVLGSVVCRGPSGDTINGSFAFRNSTNYRLAMGMALLNLTRNTPGGTLVFFPSYAALNSTVDLWRAGTSDGGSGSKTVWGMLTELKPVFVEPTDNASLKTVVSSFQKAVDESTRRGAVLLAVCRGKISEGIDFADNHGRCVVVTGIPYANHTDLFVRLKREYLTAVAPQRPKVKGKLFTGDHWYRNEAMRAVNQCIGRVIRHKDDYGAVVLADERFADQLESVSEWVARRTSVHREFRECYCALSQFFSARTVTDAAQRRSDTPSVLVQRKPGDDVVVVPSSAERAKEFALAKKRESDEHAQALLRRRLEVAGELPQGRPMRTPLAGNETAPVPFKSAAPLLRAPVAAMQRQQLVDVAPVMPALHIGPTSREFCSFLKERVAPSSYERFKGILRETAALRGEAGADKLVVREPFAMLITQLRAIFHEADAANVTTIVNEFGRHIPEELRPLYASIAREGGCK